MSRKLVPGTVNQWSYPYRLQRERLAVIEKLLQQRELDHQVLDDKRLEHLWSKKQVEKERRLRRLHSNHVKGMPVCTALKTGSKETSLHSTAQAY